MQQAPIPQNENERLAALKSLNILDTLSEERFDVITRMATKLFTVPISTISLIDSNREWYKSVCGLDKKEGDRLISFCGHAMLTEDIFIVLDTTKDPRFADNPMVTGEPFIRFYAGVPIISIDGFRIGTFCIKGKEPREFSIEDQNNLKALTRWAELEVNFHDLSNIFLKTKENEKQLKFINDEMVNRELKMIELKKYIKELELKLNIQN